MDALLQDLRYALRTLLRSPGFTLVAVLTLALGIGANTAIFSVVNAVLLRPLPYPDPDRLVMLWGTYPEFGQTTTSLPDFRDWREQSTAFGELAGHVPTTSNLAIAEGEPGRVRRAIVTANFFRTLGVQPLLGRFFLPEEEQGGGESYAVGEQVAVISHGLWHSRFAGEPAVLGTEIRLHGRPFTIVGVAPQDFRFGETRDVWTPLNLAADAGRRSEFVEVVGRLRSDATLEQARAEMLSINRRLAEEYPETNATIGVEVVPLHEQVIGGMRPALLAFMGAVGLVLLIACANVANLMLTRAAACERELAIRAALGAGRARLARQLLTESTVLALAGAGLGLLLAAAGIEALRHTQAELIPRFGEVTIDPRVLGFTFALAVGSGLLFGLAPAVRVGGRALSGVLRGGGRGLIGGDGVRRLRGALVLGEVALALMLLVGAGLLIRSFERLQQVDTGFEPRGVLSVQVALPVLQYPEPEQRVAFWHRVLESVATAPGVESAALGSNFPLSRGAGYWSFEIEGRPPSEPGSMQDAQPFTVTPGYFRTLRIPLLEGRAFEEQDHADAPRVAIVNRTVVERFFGGASPIGHRVTFGDPENPETEWWTVVGVAADTRIEGMREAPYSQIYRPSAQVGGTSMAVLLRSAGDPLQLANTVRHAVRALDPTLPVFDVKTMEQYVAEAVAQPRIGTTLLSVFAAIALLLAAIGIYGLISYTVAQRTQEIGVRMALGAQPAEVLRLVVRQGMGPVLAGTGVGLFGAWAASRLIGSLLYETSATDPPTFIGVALFLAAVGLAAAYLPARRATRVDPIIALRSE
jgi:putative ABC transport system permease protein